MNDRTEVIYLGYSVAELRPRRYRRRHRAESNPVVGLLCFAVGILVGAPLAGLAAVGML